MALASYICAVLLTVVVKSDESTIVDLKDGKIEGFKQRTEAGNSFYTFFKIPYAKPPIGELRFKEGQKPEKWEGVRNCKLMPPVCAQFEYLKMLKNYSKPFKQIGEEDCLYLNIFTKQIKPKTLSPVMFFIHGGGFVFGGADEYGGFDELLDEDILVVVIQYRVGLLGFLWTEDSIFPSNLGLKDQTMALRWVKENIESFGGDPNQVTIFGQSAGGASVHAHILSNYSKDLFSRAIVMSGTMLCPFAKMIKPKLTAMKVGVNLGCFKDHPKVEGEDKSKLLKKCLRQVNVQEIVKETRKLHEWSFLPKRSVPYVDGDFFPDNIETMVRNSKTKAIDVIYGVTKNEGAFVSGPFLANEDQRKLIVDKFEKIGPISLAFDRDEGALNLAQKAYEYYVGGIKNDLKNFGHITELFGDHHFKVCSDVAALFHSRQNVKERKNTFFYEYSYRGSNSLMNKISRHPLAEKMVVHGEDVFSFTWDKNIMTPTDKEVLRKFAKLLANFAHRGNPTPDSSLGFKWDPFTAENPRHLKIGSEPHMEEDLRKEKRVFWASLPTFYNKLLYGETTSLNKEEL